MKRVKQVELNILLLLNIVERNRRVDKIRLQRAIMLKQNY